MRTKHPAARRGLVGAPPTWGKGAWPKFVALCLQRVLEAHGRLLARKLNTSQWSENRFSAVLVRFLEQICDEETLPSWRPIRESVVDGSLEDLIGGASNPDSAKRIDILMWGFGMRCAVGFAVEAKLLSDQKLRSRIPADLTKAYVERGMARFVKGDYGRGAPEGAMLGYMLSGSATHHATQISSQIAASKLPCTKTVTTAASACCPSHFESAHPRTGEGPIRLHHLLLAV